MNDASTSCHPSPNQPFSGQVSFLPTEHNLTLILIGSVNLQIQIHTKTDKTNIFVTRINIISP